MVNQKRKPGLKRENDSITVFPHPAIADNMDDFRKVRDAIEREITQLLEPVG